ncbi:hypothetical protein J4N37_24485 [Vibrio sp. SCSIO 43153]|uniref:DUF7507 domain-containing protein n=1 Tax=Vibrio sp. SCSIO 43153 TaxID=2819098 RepID=UPI002075CF67|nr:hypothetical protein [Vibrio sp. SCSIO 43153]USD52305.1 hypothetical protein J4N37_24485 [Vibrio sp. SCSIO 43153]
MMERLIHSRLNRVMSIILVGSAALYGVTTHSPAQAEAYNLSPTEKLCMADAYLQEPGNSLPRDALNCTANDVEITRVIPTDPNAECSLGETFSFQADVTVRTNANERYDTTFYLPLTEASPQVVQGEFRNCSMILPVPGGSGETADAQIDGDACGDITKALGPDEYTLVDETITMLCTDDDGDNRADFTYCAAWDNQERDNCTIDEDPYAGQIPNTKSKCNCDTFNIDVFIKPSPPDIIKSEGTPSSRPEPGGEFTFDVSFTNPNAQTSLFISAISDEIDIDGDGTYDVSFDLWGGTTAPGASDGVYLTSTNCPMGTPLYEVGPSATYSCQFSVYVVDTDLPDIPTPELYKDVVKVTLLDKNGDPVVNGETCPAGVGQVALGEHCSVERQVQITNVPPAITVVKSADKEEVLEPGENVTFTFDVTNDSGTFDSPIELVSLVDTIYGDLSALGAESDCLDNPVTIAFGATYSCTLSVYVAGDAGDSFTNTVTATARDSENDTATDMDSHTILVLDVPSMITLEKTANPTSVFETGDNPTLFRDVDYTFLFTVKDTIDGVSTSDTVVFSSLTDNPFGVLTDDCMVDTKNGGDIAPTPLLGFSLEPGESASCTITLQVQGNAGDSHVNVATINGTDEDGLNVMAMDDATVTFDPLAPDTDLAFAVSGLVVVELTNASEVDNVTLTSLTLLGVDVVDGASSGGFTILNTLGGTYDGVFYPACNIGQVLEYSGSGNNVYNCAFTVELRPGLENTDPVTFLAQGALDGIVATVTDDEGDDLTNFISIEVNTIE